MHMRMILAFLMVMVLTGCKSNVQPPVDDRAPEIEPPNAAASPYVSKFDALAANQLGSFVESVRQTFKIPGIAIGIIDHGQIVYREGFGVTDLEAGKPVTTQTLFSLGHATRVFSGFMMAELAHEGVFRWDAPLIDLMPEFETSSQELTQQLTVADALCDCAGLFGSLMASYFTYESDNYQKAVARIRRFPFKPADSRTTPSQTQRSRNNALFSVGCYAAAKRQFPDLAVEEAFRHLMETKVFGPLDMQATTYTPNQADIAQPHGVTLDENVRKVAREENRQITRLEPAYGLWSNVDDVLRLLQAEISSQNPENLARREVKALRDETRGLGIALRMQRRREHMLLGYQNDHVGYAAMIFMIPEQQLAAVILANARFARFYLDLISAKILDIAFDQSSAPWLLEEATHKFRTAQETISRMLGKYWLITPDHAWYKPFLGNYHDDVLGRITIRDNGTDIILDVGEWQTRLGVRVDRSGTRSMLFIDPPLAGMMLTPVYEKKKLKALELQEPQVTYMFVPETPNTK